MFKGNRNLIVGIFVAAAIAGIAGLSMWLAGRQASEPMQKYSLLFEKDVSGLSLGGSVFYMGVNVGTVVDMVLVVDEIVRVRVDIDILESTPVDAGTTGSLNAQGITGVTIINLSSEPGIHPALQLTPGFNYPLIPIKQTGLGALLAEAPDLVKKISGLLDQANLLLGEENRASIGQTLVNIETITGSLAENRDALANLPGELNKTLEDVRATIGQARQILEDSGPDMTAAMENVNKATERLVSLSARIDDWLAANEAEMQHFIENGLGQAPDLISDARSMMRQLEKLLRQLQDDPSQLIHRPTEESLEVNP
jgi:phospholipid/cholesterol/gamma-HCH transport system substrate-binding protein